jgi:hypothetical protein
VKKTQTEEFPEYQKQSVFNMPNVPETIKTALQLSSRNGYGW